jgi:hypothetical protein
MNKKIISLLFLLILLVAATITYAFVNQPTIGNQHPIGTSTLVNENTLTKEIDGTFLDENASIDIGEMI